MVIIRIFVNEYRVSARRWKSSKEQTEEKKTRKDINDDAIRGNYEVSDL